MNTLDHAIHATASTRLSILKKFSLASYGLLSYVIGFAGILAIILAAGGFFPAVEVTTITDNQFSAITLNVSLTTLFGLQHSLMARRGFKRIFVSLFGDAAERSTFVWTSGVCALTMIAFWQPVDGTVWEAEAPVLQVILWCGFGVGWTYLFAATFAINHWDLFGLRQIWFAIHDRQHSEPAFRETWMYQFGRHPIMLGMLIGVWCVPTMTATQLVLATTLTVYIFIGVGYEEQDLIRRFGDTYLDYQRRVGMFMTLRSPK